jgi:hypothetical protein
MKWRNDKMIHCSKKIMRQAYEDWTTSNIYSLRDCYETFSRAKRNAFDYCISLGDKYNANDYIKIIKYNTMAFSVGFVGEIDGKQAFFYITRDYDRYIFIDEL